MTGGPRELPQRVDANQAGRIFQGFGKIPLGAERQSSGIRIGRRRVVVVCIVQGKGDLF